MRVLEARAREAGRVAHRRAGQRTAVHPDQAAAAGEIADALAGALGREVTVRPRGTGYKVELAFADLDEAMALADRVRSAAGA